MGDQTPITIKVPPLYPKQRQAFFGPERIGVIEASTKSGKTAGGHIWLLSEAIAHPGQSVLWCSPIYAQAKMQGFDRMVRMLTKADHQQSVWKCNRSDHWIELANGSRIWFKGADSPDSIYGADYAAALVDESTRCKEEAWHAVRSTLTATQGKCRIIGNVKGRSNWAYQLARKAESGEADMSYHKLTALDAVDAGIFPRSEFDDARRILPDRVFRELYLAEPSDDGGNPFGLDAIHECVDDRPTLDMVPQWFGVDLAKSQDWTVVCGLDVSGCVVHLDRWQSPWPETKQRIIRTVGTTQTLVDSTGVGDPILDDLQRMRPGVFEGFRFSSSSKQQLMEGLAAAIQQRSVRFADGWLVNELEAFEYTYTRTGCKYEAPAGLHDDGVCALALAVRHKQQRVVVNDSDIRLIGADADDWELDRAGVWSSL